jgi:hypothetical protein
MIPKLLTNGVLGGDPGLFGRVSAGVFHSLIVVNKTIYGFGDNSVRDRLTNL